MGEVSYAEFLASKRLVVPPAGIEHEVEIHSRLFPFQRDITRWALRRGRAAIFADCGLGKTIMQLEWARHCVAYTNTPAIILAPLAVAQQTKREGEEMLGLDVHVCRSQADVRPGVNITNYEMLSHFTPEAFGCVVLDESSILKSYDGSTRTALIEAFAATPFRLACTATPAPNDFMELGNHCEFLGAMTRTEMLAMFFVHDGGETQKWRLKGHAEADYWRWVCSWAVMIGKPSDLGYSDDGFALPPLEIHEHIVESGASEANERGLLFAIEARTLTERRTARKASRAARVEVAAQLANESNEPFLLWCDLNAEGDSIEKGVADAVQVSGSDDLDVKAERMLGFASGRYRALVTKPSIAGFGMNWQHCANVVFVGLSDSYEQFYQAVRRCWRFGQTRAVHAHIIISDAERSVLSNIKRKEIDAERMKRAMVEHMASITSQELRGTTRSEAKYMERVEETKNWTLMLGDCVEASHTIESDSIHYTVFSPPFASLYTYSNSERDMGNCATHGEFFNHFRFLIRDMLRATMPGRLLSFHCMNLPTSKVRDGVIGITDFRGRLIREFVDAGWIYHSEVVIWKDPVTAMQRTKALGLLHKQLKKDSCMSRQGIPDYLVTMRKPGDNPERVTHTNESFPVSLWQRFASPVWFDINPNRTIQGFRDAREENDERHICPLQLDVIERAVALWSNPGDLVFSPFAGIGSEGYQSLLMGRRFLGIELKPAYFEQAVKNLRRAEAKRDTQEIPLFANEVADSAQAVADE